MKKRTRQKFRVKAGILCAVIVAVFVLTGLISAWRSRTSLSVTYHTVSSAKLTDSIRIVHLSDLHDAQFGNGNEQLLAKVSGQKPDLILFTGDILDAARKNSSIAADLIRKLCKIAPVYFCYGNHELKYDEKYGADIGQQLAEAGAVVLRDGYTDLEVKGQPLRIGACYGHCYPDTDVYKNDIEPDQLAFMQELEHTDRLKILMVHSPVTWLRCDTLEDWDYDLVFGGHLHGGQIILPFAGGLYAPDMGFFPGRVCGMFSYANGKRTLLISRGLGSTEKIPRMNNLPEIMVTDLIPENQGKE